jgi:hypothetical protein
VKPTITSSAITALHNERSRDESENDDRAIGDMAILIVRELGGQLLGKNAKPAARHSGVSRRRKQQLFSEGSRYRIPPPEQGFGHRWPDFGPAKSGD